MDRGESSTSTKQSNNGWDQSIMSCSTSLKSLDSLEWNMFSVKRPGIRLDKVGSEQEEVPSEETDLGGEVRMLAGCLTRASVQDR